MSLPVKALGFEYDGRVGRLVGHPGAERECKKVESYIVRWDWASPGDPFGGSPHARCSYSFRFGAIFEKIAIFRFCEEPHNTATWDPLRDPSWAALSMRPVICIFTLYIFSKKLCCACFCKALYRYATRRRLPGCSRTHPGGAF